MIKQSQFKNDITALLEKMGALVAKCPIKIAIEYRKAVVLAYLDSVNHPADQP